MGDRRVGGPVKHRNESAGTAPVQQPLSVLIAALGGQGGGLLTDWIMHAARASGLVAQATSTPGVSQRTGATTYYVELARAGAALPVFALAPLPGRVDVLVCAELLEAARMLERGMCTPERTTVIASTHRAYTTREKMSGGDGRFADDRVVGALRALSRRAVLFDMETLSRRQGTAISAALFGALAGAGALPLPRPACEAAIAAAGKSGPENLAAFATAFAYAAAADDAFQSAPATPIEADTEPAAVLPEAMVNRLRALPPALAAPAKLGAARAAAFQNDAYARLYVERVEGIARSMAASTEAAIEAARSLAVWMCYDDVIRVAGVKARRARLKRIRRDVGAGPRDVVRIYDFFKPGAAEIAAILPRMLGGPIERAMAGRGFSLRVNASSLTGIAALRMLGALRPLRPWSLRFAREQAAIEAWLATLGDALDHGVDGAALALEIARLPRLARGYGDTHAGGVAVRERFLREVRAGTVDADALREHLADALHRPGTAARTAPFTPAAQPVTWFPSPRR